MKSVLTAAVLLAASLAPVAGVADDNPLKRCKNHYILRFHQGCVPIVADWVTAAPLRTFHGVHTATLLDDGRVLVAGDTGVPEMTAEIYDPATDSWTLTGPMKSDRAYHAASRLADGRVLAVGGERSRGEWDWSLQGSAEIFDPRTSRWTATASLAKPRGGFTATLLPTGEVLVVGGSGEREDSLSSAELFDPVSARWKPAASLRIARFLHTATALPDGNVLVVGGWYDDMLQEQVREVEIYDWKSDSWSPAGTITGRAAHSATLLDDGRVLVAGGYTSGFRGGRGWRQFSTLDTAVIFDPATREWSDAGNIGTPRFGHLAASLRGGGALIVQGTESYDQVPEVKYRPVGNALTYSGAISDWVDMGVPATEPAATSVTRLHDGTLLFVGQNRAVLFRY